MHTCHAIECKVKVPPAMLMCKKHWFSVPHPIRIRVLTYYRKGQEGDWKPSKAYCCAAQDAVRAAGEAEGRKVTGQEKEILFYEAFKPREAR